MGKTIDSELLALLYDGLKGENGGAVCAEQDGVQDAGHGLHQLHQEPPRQHRRSVPSLCLTHIINKRPHGRQMSSLSFWLILHSISAVFRGIF